MWKSECGRDQGYAAGWWRVSFTAIASFRTLIARNKLPNHVSLGIKEIQACRAVRSNLHHAAAVALHFIHYNFARIHKSLRITPAMAAGLSDHVWNYEEIAALTEWGGQWTRP